MLTESHFTLETLPAFDVIDTALSVENSSYEMPDTTSHMLSTISRHLNMTVDDILTAITQAQACASSSQQHAQLDAVINSTDGLRTLARNLFDYMAIQEGLLALTQTTFSLHAMLDAALQPLAARAAQKGLQLVSSISGDVPDVIIGDYGRLCQILRHLVENAITHTERGVVQVRVLHIVHTPTHVTLRFEVSDSGCGIQLSQQRRIFDAFTQAGDSDTCISGSIGLGLPICAGLVALMDGQIGVESAPGTGSTFHIQLCMPYEPQPHALRLTCTAGEIVRRLHVLVVDEVSTQRHALMAQLAHWGVASAAADDCEHARTLMALATDSPHPFSVVLLNARNTDMDSLVLAQRLHHHPCCASAFIVLYDVEEAPLTTAQQRRLGTGVCLATSPTPARLLDALLAIPIITPYTSGNPQPEEKASPTTAALPLSILIVDDTEFNQRLLARMMQKFGYQVATAFNGEEALACWQRESYDCVLMDLMMPTMDGFQATAAIRQAEHASGVHQPIIAVTASEEIAEPAQYLAAGFDGYIRKPVSSENVLGEMARVFATLAEQAVPPDPIPQDAMALELHHFAGMTPHPGATAQSA